MKKLLIAILFVLVTVSGFAAGTTTETSGKAVTAKSQSLTSQPSWFLYNASGSQSIPNGAATTRWFWEGADPLGIAVGGVVTISEPGWYLMGYKTYWKPGFLTGEYVQTNLSLGGVNVSSVISSPITGHTDFTQGDSVAFYVPYGSVLSLKCSHSHASAIAINEGDHVSVFWGVKLF